MEATAAALRDLGVQVSITDAARPDCCDCDLLHIFNAPDPELTLCRIRAGKDQSVPVALSTIYWNGYELHMQWAERGWRTAREQDGANRADFVPVLRHGEILRQATSGSSIMSSPNLAYGLARRIRARVPLPANFIAPAGW